MYTFTHQEYLEDSDLHKLFFQLHGEGLYDKVFYENNHPIPSSFVTYVREQCWFVKVTNTSGQNVGAFWLSDFSGKAAFFHYWVFKAGWGESKAIQEETLRWLAKESTLITTLIGKTPASNRLAVRFLKQAGFKILDAIPDAIRFADGTFDDAIISYRRLTDEDL
jgi:RimJ/RimL family protein N-acetyltransferase